MECLGAYFTHVQTCNVTRVQSATEWTASVHSLHMSKPVLLACAWQAKMEKRANFGLWEKPFAWSNTELQADLQSHVLLGHRDLDTGDLLVSGSLWKCWL